MYPQSPAPYEGVSSYVEHCVTKFGAAKLPLEPTLRFLLSPCGLACTNPGAKGAAADAVKALYKQRGPLVSGAVEKLAATADPAAIKAANAAIEV